MNEKECTCPKITCERHGNCELCEEHHKESAPFCKREKNN